MRLNKTALLGGAALVAVMAASPASAFNKVEWQWDLDFYENIYKTITIDVEFDPTGVALLQFGQIQIGDVHAVAIMYDVHNNQPTIYEVQEYDFTATGTAEGFVDIDFGHYTDNCGVDGDLVCTGEGNEDGRVGLIGIAGNPAGESLTENGVPGTVGSEDPLHVEVSGTIEIPVVQALDAVDLPKIENIATAVGNNASLTSTRMVEFHGGQFLFDVEDRENGSYPVPLGVQTSLSNSGHGTDPNPYGDAALALTLGTILGVVDKADVHAFAKMANVTNGQMETAATAVGNNFSVEVNADTDGDAVIMGDQIGRAHV